MTNANLSFLILCEATFDSSIPGSLCASQYKEMTRRWKPCETKTINKGGKFIYNIIIKELSHETKFKLFYLELEGSGFFKIKLNVLIIKSHFS